MSIAEGYVMDLQCDADPGYFHRIHQQFFGKDKRNCHRAAKKEGWMIDAPKWKAYCPSCAQRMQEKFIEVLVEEIV